MEVKYVENPRLNGKVARVIEELKKEIFSRFHPKSIILAGSFGRGEATVIEENGKLKFLSDCEVILIPYKWIFNRGKLEKFEQDFYKRTGLKVEIWGFTPTLYLFLTFLSKKIRPTIANYDLKYGSKVIYGKNYLEKIPNFKPEDIPLWEGIRLMLNRMAEALEYFSIKNPTKEMLFWTDKIVLACRDSLLLLLKEYTPSFRQRNIKFIELSDRFDLSCTQEIVKFATEATNRKLGITSSVSKTKEEIIKYWFEVQRVCDEVFRYILKKGCGIEFRDYIGFQKKYLSSKLKRYTTLPFNNTAFQNLFRFVSKKVTKNRLPTLRMLLKPYIPWDHIIYSSIPLIYFGLQNNGVNGSYLKKIKEVVDSFGIKIDNPNDWYYVKDVIVSCWRQMRL